MSQAQIESKVYAMYCRYCGNKMEDEDKVCSACGKPVEPEIAVKDAAVVDAGTGEETVEPPSLLSEEEKARILADTREKKAREEERAGIERREAEAKAAAEAARPVRLKTFEDEPELGAGLSEEEKAKILAEVLEKRAEAERKAAEERQAKERALLEAKQKEEAEKKAAAERIRAASGPADAEPGAGQAGRNTDRTDYRSRPEAGKSERKGQVLGNIFDLAREMEAERHQGDDGYSAWQRDSEDGRRSPYGAGNSAAAEKRETSRADRFAKISRTLAILSAASLMLPFITVPGGIMALLFGILALREDTICRKSAVCGIVVGAAAIILGCVLIWCLAAMAPYEQNLISIFQAYLAQSGR